jgi:heme exporter protein B
MIALLKRDLAIATRSGGAAMLGVLFFLAVVAVIPFGIGPDLNMLARIGPAILWIGALLASLLGLDRLFQADREDGSLDMLVMQDWFGLILTVFVKSRALARHRPAAGSRRAAAGTADEHGRHVHGRGDGDTAGRNAGNLLHRRGGCGGGRGPAARRSAGVDPGAAAGDSDPDFRGQRVLCCGHRSRPVLPPFMILSAIALFFAALGPCCAAAALRGASD